MHISPEELHANALVDAFIAIRPGFAPGAKRPAFSIPADVAYTLSRVSEASREYNLSRLIQAHNWNANANAFGAVPQWDQVRTIRDFEAQHDHFMAIARDAYEAALDERLAA